MHTQWIAMHLLKQMLSVCVAVKQTAMHAIACAVVVFFSCLQIVCVFVCVYAKTEKISACIKTAFVPFSSIQRSFNEIIASLHFSLRTVTTAANPILSCLFTYLFFA